MRVIGLSWSDWKTPWSSSKDEYIGTEDQLRVHLKEVLKEEHSLEIRGLLPSKVRALATPEDLVAECPAPQLRRKTFKSLGTPTVQAAALSNDKTDLDPEAVAAAAQRRRRELEIAGEIDWVADRQPYQTGQVTRTLYQHTCPCASLNMRARLLSVCHHHLPPLPYI